VSDARLRDALDVLTDPGDTIQAADQQFVDAQKWRHGRNIVGYGIARRITRGVVTGELALKVYVREKLPRSALRAQDVVPEHLDVPGVNGSVTFDVEPVGVQRLDLLGQRRRPLSPGFSVGAGRDAGTLGCFVTLSTDTSTSAKKRRFLLSNAHVIAGSGFSRKGSPVFQPAREEDGGLAGDKVATLFRSSKLSFLASRYTNLIDAAIALITEKDLDPVIPHVGPIAGVNFRIMRGMKIKKFGRTTGLTHGEVRDIDYRTFLRYPTPRGLRKAGFKNLVFCTRYSEPGDSGSVILDSRNNVVGLHICGQSSGSSFIPIKAVCDELGVRVLSVRR
jgi:hypothetical protein